MTKDTIYMDEEMRGEEDLVSETKIQPMPQKKQAIVPAPQPEDKELVPYDPLQR